MQPLVLRVERRTGGIAVQADQQPVVGQPACESHEALVAGWRCLEIIHERGSAARNQVMVAGRDERVAAMPAPGRLVTGSERLGIGLRVDHVAQAEATLAAAESQRAAADAELENARHNLERTNRLLKSGVATPEQLDSAQTSYAVGQAKVAALARQVEAQRAAVALATTDAEQIAVRRNQLHTYRQQSAAATAQQKKADVRLAYAELHTPIAGTINVRAARAGEVVSAGQPVVTIVDPDDLWVRGDVEETYIDRIRIGDTLTVRLPSGEERPGKVTYRGVDAGFATQRDVSRTKRDIKTFEIRLRVDNKDRRLAPGMTAYVLLPL